MARLYSDENFPLPAVEALRQFGHDVVTIYDAGKANQRYADEYVLQDASLDGRAVLTTNRKHFRRLHLQSLRHGGIIACTYDPDFVGQARRIHETLKTYDQLVGQLILIYRPQA